MIDVLSKKPQIICKEILQLINNNNVNVEKASDSKKNFYVFLNNTIYISDKKENITQSEKEKKSKLLVIAHECRHSVQSKFWQMINFCLSNIEIILFIILLIIKITTKSDLDYVKLVYLVVSISAIFVRLFLELDAVINSVKIVTQYLFKNDVKKELIKELILYYKKEIMKALPLFVINLFLLKIIKISVILAII